MGTADHAQGARNLVARAAPVNLMAKAGGQVFVVWAVSGRADGKVLPRMALAC